MNRVLFFTVSLLFILGLSAAPASAEFDWDEHAWYGQGVFAIPLGDFSDYAGIGLGIGGGVAAPFSELITGRAEAEWIYFTESNEVNAWMLPILALAEFHFNPDVPAYGLGGLGVAWRNVSSGGYSNTDTELNLILGGGYNFNENMGLEGRFSLISDSNSLSAQFNYYFR